MRIIEDYMKNVIGRKESFCGFLPSFTKVGTVYDKLMDFVDYEGWIDYIEKLILFFGKYPQTILDIGCGTGTASIIFAKKGYKVTGIDISTSMLNSFKDKIKQEKVKVKVVRNDMRNISPSLGNFDVVISMFDTINYNLTESELKSTFNSVFKRLKPRGIFIFDVNTIHCFEDIWGNKVTTREVNGIFSIWKNSYDVEKKISTLFLTIFKHERENIYTRFDEVHKERGYELEEITQCLKEVGFYYVRCYKYLTLLPGNEKNLRVNFVALKAP